jgi:hypothetical protein
MDANPMLVMRMVVGPSGLCVCVRPVRVEGLGAGVVGHARLAHAAHGAHNVVLVAVQLGHVTAAGRLVQPVHILRRAPAPVSPHIAHTERHREGDRHTQPLFKFPSFPRIIVLSAALHRCDAERADMPKACVPHGHSRSCATATTSVIHSYIRTHRCTHMPSCMHLGDGVTDDAGGLELRDANVARVGPHARVGCPRLRGTRPVPLPQPRRSHKLCVVGRLVALGVRPVRTPIVGDTRLGAGGAGGSSGGQGRQCVRVCVCVCVCVYVYVRIYTCVCVCATGGGGIGASTTPAYLRPAPVIRTSRSRVLPRAPPPPPPPRHPPTRTGALGQPVRRPGRARRVGMAVGACGCAMGSGTPHEALEAQVGILRKGRVHWRHRRHAAPRPAPHGPPHTSDGRTRWHRGHG